MEILIKRNPIEDWNMNVVCNGIFNTFSNLPCGSELKIDVNDIYFYDWYDKNPPYMRGFTYGFICPVCKTFTPIEDNKVTTLMRLWAKDAMYIN